MSAAEERKRIERYLESARLEGKLGKGPSFTEIDWPADGTVRINGATYRTLRAVRRAVEGR